MADASYRFHQSGGGHFFPAHQARNHNRVTSPHGPRRPILTDTPSPSRSPASSNMVHNFSVYGQNGYQGQHLMNGGQNHQRFNNMHNLPKQHQNHHNHHSHHYGSQQHNGQIGHQHNISASTYQGSTPQSHIYDMPNGAREESEISDPPENPYMAEQTQWYKELQEANESHARARSYAQDTKGHTSGASILGGGGDTLSLADRIQPAMSQAQTAQSWAEIDMGGQGLRALSDSLFKYDFLTRLNLPHNNLQTVSPALGKLRKLEYLDLSFNHLQQLPEEIGMLTNLKTLHISGNKGLPLPWTLGYLYNLESLSVMDCRLPEPFENAILEGGTRGLINFMLENMPDADPPRPRDWCVLEDGPADSAAETVRVVTYNILCERYATPSKYGYVPEKFLSWSFRRQVILQELLEQDADIICLQELDRNSFEDFFRGRLAARGYKGVFAQKSRAETLGDNARGVDGCGTFWKDRKYVMLENQQIVLGRRAVDRPGAKASSDMLNRVWQRDDIAMFTFLENRVTGARLIVANSHVYWDPAFKDVKLIQVAVLLEELNKHANRWARDQKATPLSRKQVYKFTDDTDGDEAMPEPGASLEYASGAAIPTIVCGDFNSGPGSPVYELFTKRRLEANHGDFTGRDYGSLSTDGMSHDFNLKSTNALVSPSYITNYTPDFADELDHIFFSTNSLTPIGVLGEVDPEYLSRTPGFPNAHFPSDHLLLAAEFRVEKQRSTKAVEADFGPSSSSVRRN